MFLFESAAIEGNGQYNLLTGMNHLDNEPSINIKIDRKLICVVTIVTTLNQTIKELRQE